MSENDAFAAYRNRPTPDTLVALLRAHQGRVFRLCYQVLHNAHDAEDAAQGVLIRIPAEIRRFDDADAFRRWLYRVSLNAALEVARRAARRKAHESRAAMEKPAPQPLDDATRLSLFEAIAELDDASRNLILEHHFEGETLEMLGRREGVSAPAMHKRLDHARENLRRRLGGIVVPPSLESLFPPTPPPPDLVTGPVLAAAGGIGVGMKITGVVAVVMCLAVGPGVIFTGRGDSPAKPAVPVNAPVLSTRAPEAASLEITGGAPESEASESKPAPSPLVARLSAFNDWWSKTCAGNETRFKSADFRNKHDKELWELLRGLKELILADPETFLAFLKDPANESKLMDFTVMNVLTLSDRIYVEAHWPLAECPPILSRGLFDLLHDGSRAQKIGVMRLLSGFPEQPDEFRATYQWLMEDADPEVQGFSIYMVGLTMPISTTLFERLKGVGSTSPSEFVRRAVVTTLRAVKTSEADAFVLGRLEAATEAEVYTLAFDLRIRFEAAELEGRKISQEHLERTLMGVINRNPGAFDWAMAHPASFLTASRLKSVLATAAARTKDGVMRERYFKTIEMIDQGQSDRRELLRVLDPPPK